MKAIDVKSLLSAKVMSPSDVHEIAPPPPAPALNEGSTRGGRSEKRDRDGDIDGAAVGSGGADAKALLSDKKFVQALAKEINADLKKTVVETTKKCFQESFTKSLVPSFEAGVNSMCGEVQAGFKGSQELVQELAKKGMPAPGVTKMEFETMMKRLDDNLASMNTRMEAIEKQGAETRASFKTLSRALENTMDDVLDKLQGQGATSAASVPAEVNAVRTPMQLLQAGEVSRAMEAALELKSIDELLELLREVKPQMVLEKCRKIVVLCTTQQLAVDLSTRSPPEGLDDRLDWIKNLVMHVVFDKSAANDTSEKAEKERNYMAVVMSSVKEAIEATQAKLRKSAEDGEEIPASAMTDLNLLKNLVQTA